MVGGAPDTVALGGVLGFFVLVRPFSCSLALFRSEFMFIGGDLFCTLTSGSNLS